MEGKPGCILSTSSVSASHLMSLFHYLWSLTHGLECINSSLQHAFGQQKVSVQREVLVCALLVLACAPEYGIVLLSVQVATCRQWPWGRTPSTIAAWSCTAASPAHAGSAPKQALGALRCAGQPCTACCRLQLRKPCSLLVKLCNPVCALDVIGRSCLTDCSFAHVALGLHKPLPVRMRSQETPLFASSLGEIWADAVSFIEAGVT